MDSVNSKLKLSKARKQQRKLDISNNVIQSQSLFDKTDVISIQHGEKAYQLRLTRYNKLILTC